MNEPNVPDLVEALKALPPVTLELCPATAWCLLAQLQLACRHPENTGISRHVVERIARDIQTQIAQTEPLRTIAEMGWHRECDVGPSN